MQAENIKTLSFGCRLNALESEKIGRILAGAVDTAIVINTCAVTAEGERQSAQAVRRVARENVGIPIFVTGCAATRNPTLFAQIPNVIVIHNRDKMNRDVYTRELAAATLTGIDAPCLRANTMRTPKLSKQFIQVQNGCNHACTYCVTRLVRGPGVSFAYTDILANARRAVADGFTEIVLTGVDTASYARDGMLISDVCVGLLRDVDGLRRLRLSSLDPASPEIDKILDLMAQDRRMMPHIHLSMQSGCDPILAAMGRRHTADRVRAIVTRAPNVTFSWDIICGFPGETDELFNQTLNLARELQPIHIHAFPFSPRPGTVAATMPNQVPRAISKSRVAQISAIADENRIAHMTTRVGQETQVLVESRNFARDTHDIPVRIAGTLIPPRAVCDVRITGIDGDTFIAERIN